MKDDPARAERLATALRANLARRKTRERAAGGVRGPSKVVEVERPERDESVPQIPPTALEC